MNYTDSTRSSRVAGEVRAEMARKRFTMGSLSQAADMSMATLSRRLKGTTSFTLDELSRVAAVLDVTVTELVARSEEQAA